MFDLAKQDVAGYETYAGQIAALFKDERKLLQHVLEGLMYVAASDGALHPKEDEFLTSVATRFGFSDSEFRFFRARFVTDHGNPYDALRLTRTLAMPRSRPSTASSCATTIPTA